MALTPLIGGLSIRSDLSVRAQQYACSAQEPGSMFDRYNHWRPHEKLEVAFDAMNNANPPPEFLFRWKIRISVIKGDYPSAINCLQEIWENELPYKPEIALSKLILGIGEAYEGVIPKSFESVLGF